MAIVTERFDLAYDDPKRVVRGRVERPEGTTEPLPWVLLCHGFKGFMDWGFFPLLSRGLAESGFAVVRFNTSDSGVGEDLLDFSDLEGFARGSYSRQLEDFERVRELALSGSLGALDAERCALIGHSRGGGMGLVHASEHPYRALSLWAPIDDGDRFDDETKARWRAEGRIMIPNMRTGQAMPMDLSCLEDFEAHRERFRILAAAERTAAPTLVVHGTADASVEFACAERIVERLPNGTLVPLEGAGHTFEAAHPLTEVPPALEQALGATLQHLLEHV